MAAGSSDFVDCVRLAEESAVFERTYELRDLPRMNDVLADPRGTARVNFVFSTSAGRPGATVTVSATPSLVCQRCMQDFVLPVTGSSEIEFASDDESPAGDAEREVFKIENGLVSLRELAEEELLLALPIAPACSTPLTCGRAPGYATDEMPGPADEMRRPFSSLQNLLKKDRT